MLVTESGIAADDDRDRVTYLDAALRGIHECIAEGVDVRGYFVWSLLDNFEWNLGYGPKFGLHAVDRTTFERTAKPSADWFAEVARTNGLAVLPATRASAGADAVQIVVLGSGSPLPHPERAGPSTLVRTAVGDLLVDCGRGVLLRAAAAGSGAGALRGRCSSPISTATTSPT